MSSTVSVDRSGSRPAGRRSRKTSKKKAASTKGLRGFFQDRRLHLAIYFAFILLVGLTGGGSRPDILSLLLLRPLAALFLIYIVWRISADELKAVRFPLLFIGSLMVIALLQLVPLPPVIWSSLPGREGVAQLDELFGMQDVWRPLSLEPSRTWNAFFSMFVPLVAVGFVGLLWNRERRWILPPILAMGVLSMVVGYLQALGADSLYFYRVTHGHHPVGLFANKNHQAVLLNWLLLTVCYMITRIDLRDRRASLRLASGLALVFLIYPLLFVTGSRAGLLLCAPVSVVCAVMLWQAPALNRAWQGSSRRVRLAITGLGGSVLAALAMVFGYLAITERQTALTRLFESDPADELRWIYLPKIFEMMRDHWLEGIGFGAFESVFYGYENVENLSTSYLNQAHFEPLQYVIETGLAGLLLLVAALAWVVRRLLRLWRAGEGKPRILAVYLCGALGVWLIAGLVDYPTRTPLGQLVFAILTGFLAVSSIDLERHRKIG
tara:strand:- start:116359 stop:117840 length:1482 start_codon:yes stop_codon:yes gene_type:complete